MIVRRPSGFIPPCQPSKASRPPSGPQWVHEIKHDGYRLMVRLGERIRSAAWGWRASSQSGRMRHTGVGHRGCGSSRRTRPVRRCGGSKSSSGGSVHQTENRTTATRATLRTVAIPATSMMEALFGQMPCAMFVEAVERRHSSGQVRATRRILWTAQCQRVRAVDRRRRGPRPARRQSRE